MEPTTGYTRTTLRKARARGFPMLLSAHFMAWICSRLNPLPGELLNFNTDWGEGKLRRACFMLDPEDPLSGYRQLLAQIAAGNLETLRAAVRDGTPLNATGKRNPARRRPASGFSGKRLVDRERRAQFEAAIAFANRVCEPRRKALEERKARSAQMREWRAAAAARRAAEQAKPSEGPGAPESPDSPPAASPEEKSSQEA